MKKIQKREDPRHAGPAVRGIKAGLDYQSFWDHSRNFT